MPFLPPNQQRQSTEGNALTTYLLTFLLVALTEVLMLEEQSPSKQMELCDVQADSFMRGQRHLDSEARTCW